MTPGALRRALGERALREGFDGVGVARAGRPERDARTLEAWIAAGRAASMAWMVRDPNRRSDPRRILPGCTSVIAVFANYDPGEPSGARPACAGRVARYARGRDYHRVLGPALRRLAAWLEKTTGESARAFVDTGPVLERAWAERAGLGWIGKNANLIRRDAGSWLFLGEILACASIEPDDGPHQDFCGTCTACLDACPTRAIVAPGVVDARDCIAYWNIEHRGTIPTGMREGIGDWLFGCDVCQEVCPWNRSFARPVPAERFGRRPDLDAPDPCEILALDERAFRERYSGTSFMRARWDGMRRNACVVLGNQRREDAVPILARTLGDADPLLRGHAAWALGRIGGPVARRALDEAEERERDPGVLSEIRHARRGI